jgi:hypothetical protein
MSDFFSSSTFLSWKGLSDVAAMERSAATRTTITTAKMYVYLFELISMA